MKIPYQRWQKAIKVRHSSRTYDGQTLESETAERLKTFIEKAKPNFQGVRAVFINDGGGQVVQSIIGSYGFFKGVRSYLAFVADKRADHIYEKTGYLGEMCILEATSLGLGTCWISGTFNPGVVEKQLTIKTSEKIMAITPVGYPENKKSLVERIMKKAVGSYKRKTLEELCPEGYNENWPLWIREALQLARVAPSAANRQPWRFKVAADNRGIKVMTDNTRSLKRKRLDCGIAMLHIEVGALNNGVEGEWEYLEKPEIAKYKPVE